MSMIHHLNPATIRPPFARYSHAVVIEAGARMLFCSGQLGIDADQRVPSDAGGQAQICFANIDAMLDAAGMDRRQIVRINAYVTGREHMAGYMQARDAYIGELTPPASTLMIVGGFSRPEFVVEIEVIAAGA
jgi:enamine deaminase RidA (YjgF/YER057c/UK114 family)